MQEEFARENTQRFLTILKIFYRTTPKLLFLEKRKTGVDAGFAGCMFIKKKGASP